MDDDYSKPPIIIESHELLASNIRGAMNEIATMRGTNFLPFLGSYKLSIFWLFFGLPFSCLPCDGSNHRSFIGLLSVITLCLDTLYIYIYILGFIGLTKNLVS